MNDFNNLENIKEFLKMWSNIAFKEQTLKEPSKQKEGEQRMRDENKKVSQVMQLFDTSFPSFNCMTDIDGIITGDKPFIHNNKKVFKVLICEFKKPNQKVPYPQIKTMENLCKLSEGFLDALIIYENEKKVSKVEIFNRELNKFILL